jgi:hypothetical protein
MWPRFAAKYAACATPDEWVYCSVWQTAAAGHFHCERRRRIGRRFFSRGRVAVRMDFAVVWCKVVAAREARFRCDDRRVI